MTQAVASIAPPPPPPPTPVVPPQPMVFLDAKEMAGDLFDKFIGPTIKGEGLLDQQYRVAFYRRLILDYVGRELLPYTNNLTHDVFLTIFTSALKCCALTQ